MESKSHIDVKIGAIMVLYKPNFALTNKAIENLCTQVDVVCIVDNTPETDNSKLIVMPKNLHYIPLKENVGIAAAQNLGIRHLFECGMEYMLFSDQDSILENGVVKKLFIGYQDLTKNGIKVGVVGCNFYDRETGKYYLEGLKLSYEEMGINPIDGLTPASWCISSGSLISSKALKENGGMDESLFIDGVDDEWCWRGSYNCKMKHFIKNDAIISHSLGVGSNKIVRLRFSISSSFRVYYQFRNYFWLCSLPYTPLFFKKRHAPKFFIKLFYYSIFTSHRIEYIKRIIKGIKDGVLCYKKYGKTRNIPNFND